MKKFGLDWNMIRTQTWKGYCYENAKYNALQNRIAGNQETKTKITVASAAELIIMLPHFIIQKKLSSRCDIFKHKMR